MILADTNVLSALMQAQPDPAVVQWLDQQPRASVWIASITVLEIRFGLEIMTSGKRRSVLSAAFEKLLSDGIESRIASFDSAAADEAAKLMASRKGRGQPGELRDTMIAGIALANRAAIATRNVKHFADVSCQVINPWSA
ncbi:MAG TPA: type II toxin-antitoxin system VapC family toxin [Terracidiphilus sp.]|jgi:toxin FitB|nr:type II toxin-antitoxin system VapC family toxin [Terracidiphilus sp.]